MNKSLLGLLVGLAVGATATWLYLKHAGGADVPAASVNAAAKPEEKPDPLRLPPAKREQAGITLAKPAMTAVAPEVRAYGRVLDAAPLVAIVAESETARAALQASEKELERARKLFQAGGNASAQTVETAEASVARDRASLGSAEARLAVSWGRNVAQNAAAILDALSKGGGTLVRIDLLPGDQPAPQVREARVSLAGRPAVMAEIIGPAATADAQVQGVSFLALVRDATLPVGAALQATLPAAGEAANSLVIPRGAVVYHQGSAWVFVLGEEDTFERKLVTLGRGVEADRVVVLGGVDADEQVAVTGAEQLLAAELQAGGAAEEP